MTRRPRLHSAAFLLFSIALNPWLRPSFPYRLNPLVTFPEAWMGIAPYLGTALIKPPSALPVHAAPYAVPYQEKGPRWR